MDPENVRHLRLYVVDRINYFESMYILRAHLQARSVQITCYISRPNMMECRTTGVWNLYVNGQSSYRLRFTSSLGMDMNLSGRNHQHKNTLEMGFRSGNQARSYIQENAYIFMFYGMQQSNCNWYTSAHHSLDTSSLAAGVTSPAHEPSLASGLAKSSSLWRAVGVTLLGTDHSEIVRNTCYIC